jgi:hypothetical protein
LKNRKEIGAYGEEKFIERGKWVRTRKRIRKTKREKEEEKNGRMFLEKNNELEE